MGINWDALQWGTVGSWVSGIGTLAVVLLTVVLARREARHARTQHARMVRFGIRRGMEIDGNEVRVFNGSSGHILNISFLGPAFAEGGASVVASKERLKPGKRWSVVVPDADKWSGYVFFTDVNGQRWAWNVDDESLTHLNRARAHYLMFGATWKTRLRRRLARLRK